MYLGNLLVMLAFSMMSGIWFSPFISLGAYAFVYSNPVSQGRFVFREELANEVFAIPGLIIVAALYWLL